MPLTELSQASTNYGDRTLASPVKERPIDAVDGQQAGVATIADGAAIATTAATHAAATSGGGSAGKVADASAATSDALSQRLHTVVTADDAPPAAKVRSSRTPAHTSQPSRLASSHEEPPCVHPRQ